MPISPFYFTSNLDCFTIISNKMSGILKELKLICEIVDTGLAMSAAKRWVEERHGIEKPVCQVCIKVSVTII